MVTILALAVGGWDAIGWAAVSGVCGAAGLIAFYAGFAAAPISVVAPVAALVSTVLPVGVAIAGGERPTASMVAGGLICLAAIVLVSMPPAQPGRPGSGRPDASRVSGAVDAAANVCYVLATRAGLFGLAVVITALYPGTTVLLARWLLGERMRRLQRAGLLLASVGVVLLTA